MKRFLRDSSGQGMPEYVLIVTFVALSAIAAYVFFKNAWNREMELPAKIQQIEEVTPDHLLLADLNESFPHRYWDYQIKGEKDYFIFTAQQKADLNAVVEFAIFAPDKLDQPRWWGVNFSGAESSDVRNLLISELSQTFNFDIRTTRKGNRYTVIMSKNDIEVIFSVFPSKIKDYSWKVRFGFP